MAGDWIPLCTTLPRKREVLQLARMTGLPRHEVVGLLVEFWCWVDSETVDGVVDAVVDADLSTTFGVSETFFAALRSVGWLASTPDGRGISIPNFGRWFGKNSKKRLQKNLRQASWRVGKGCVGASVDAHVDARASTEAPTREEKSIEENKDNTPPSPPCGGADENAKPKRSRNDRPMPDIPASLDTPEFRAAWSDWLAFRAERKPKVTPCAADQQLKRLAEWGPARAVAAIRNSIANSYQGIFENGHGQANGQPTKSKQDQAEEFLANWKRERGEA